MIDFGDAPVFTAIAYPTILVAHKKAAQDSGADSMFHTMTWQPGQDVADFVHIYARERFAMHQDKLSADGWQLESEQVLALLDKLTKAGTLLGDYVNGRFYRGVTTGCNEAFVIDRATLDRLITEDPKCEEIIKPYLRGRDVKRWVPFYADLWLIFPRRGIDIDQYPAVKKHLSTFKSKLTPGIKGGRKPGNYKWYEIQDDTKYWKEFDFPKVIYPDIAQRAEFAFDQSGAFLANTLYLVPEASRYILGLLNSVVVWWFYNQVSPKIRGGFVRFIGQYVAQIPIPPATSVQQSEIEKRVENILTLKKKNPESEVSELETEIDQLVYKLYGLTPDEIAIVEEQSR